MNGRDMMPACARIAAADPAMADRMWNTTTDDDGRDLVDERMRGKGRMLCAACPMRRDGRDYWRRAKRRQRSRREYATDDPLFLPTEPVPKGLVQGSLF